LKESFSRPASQRIDLDLPLGLRMNALLEIPEIDFILGGNDLKMKHPGGTLTVASMGKIPMGDSTVHRFYANLEGGVYVLQVVVDSNHAIEECKLFTLLDEVYPDDWGFWLAESDGYIGLDRFQIKDGTVYYRVWDSQGGENPTAGDQQSSSMSRIAPVHLEEMIYMDPYGEQKEMVRYESMLYGRHVNDNVDEYLLVSAAEEINGASVQIMLGIDLQPASIKVI